METPLPRTKPESHTGTYYRRRMGRRQTDRQSEEPHREGAKADNKKKRFCLPLAHLSTHLTLSLLSGAENKMGKQEDFFL